MLHIVCLPVCKALNDYSNSKILDTSQYSVLTCPTMHYYVLKKYVLAYIHAGASFFSEKQIIPGSIDAQNEKCQCASKI